MRNAAPLTLLLTVLAAGTSARAEARRPEHSRPAGRTYVRVEDWARANRFAVRWIERDKTLQLSNRWTQIEFNVDSRRDTRRAQINGVLAWLACPLTYRNGSAAIAQLDLDATLTPVLSPATNRSGAKIKTICLDPGHGGTDPGYQVGSRDEKKYTLLLAQAVRDELKKAGFEVVLTRTTDTYVKPSARPEVAKRRSADLFVSLHFNSAGGQHNEVKGVEVYCLTPAGAFSTNSGGEGDTRPCPGNRQDDKNILLAFQMQSALTRSLSIEDRGVRRARFQVLRDAVMPAILIEGGFMSSPAEGRRIFDPAYRSQMARAIAGGILAYQQKAAR